MKKRPRLILVLAGMMLTYFSGCGPQTLPPPKPRIVIVLVIEQLRYDYLVRFGSLFSGGLAELAREGAVFTNARHRHALTECAPGHATLLTGCYPSQHGIVGDQWYDRSRRRLVSSVEDSSCTILNSPFRANAFGKSPRQLLRTTLGDWLKAEDSSSQVISLASSDLAAILMGGRRADAAYWFDPTSGKFSSSTHYLPGLPAWVKKWNDAAPGDRFFNATWEKLLTEADYLLSREDLFVAEADGIHTTFPHPLNEEGESLGANFYQRLAASPFGDELVLEFALATLRAQQLGKDEHADLLCLGLSATHSIGKTYGPLSQEQQDNLVRLDLNLGNFLEEVEREIGREHLLVALASDHGVLPLPEELRRRGFEAARVSAEEAHEEITGALQELANAKPDSVLIAYAHNGLYLHTPGFGNGAIQTQAQIAAHLRTLSFVADVFTAGELASQATEAREYGDVFRNGYFAGRSPEILFRRKPYFLIGGPRGTAAGSMYDYDTHVPLIFWGEGLKAGHYEMPCSTVDFAPTLAHWLGLSIPREVAGQKLTMESDGLVQK